MKFGDEFVLEFGDKFGESPNLGTNVSPNLGTNLGNPQIWGQICPQICPQKAREHICNVGIKEEIGKWVLFTQWMLKSWSVRYPHLKLQFGVIRNLYTWNSSHLNDTQKYEDVKGTAKHWHSVLAKKQFDICWMGGLIWMDLVNC